MHKILIVDDDPALVDFLKLLPDSEGYETYEATDGAMALEEIARVSPEVVLLDYMMPDMDGLDVLHNVSKNFTSSFVVMLTGKGSEEVAVQCMKEGAVDYVIKPFDNDRLLSAVRNAFGYRETELQKRVLTRELQQLLARVTELLESKASDPQGAEALELLRRARET